MGQFTTGSAGGTAFKVSLRLGFPTQNVIQSRQPLSRAVALQRNRAVTQD